MRIVLAGASGFLGSRLHQSLLADGVEVVQLVRRSSQPALAGTRVEWRPETGELDPQALAGADAVVNLAGAGVADRRWSPEYRQLLRTSRLGPTSTIAAAIAALPAARRPKALLNGSAIGFYGVTGDTPVDEDSPAGDGFFPQLCQDWEAAAEPAAQAGTRVVLLRTGLPLDAHEGLLKPLMLPMRLGVGGRLGDGKQWLAWISMMDWLAAVRFLLDHSQVSGAVNLVGPAPARNTDFTKALAAAVHRPAWLPVPRFALRIALGEFANDALASQRVLPATLPRNGFRFTHPELAAAMTAALAT